MDTRVYIIHGWQSTSASNWFPWLREELVHRDIRTRSLSLPHADRPVMEEWLGTMHDVIGTNDERVFLVGHSLGVIAILRYLEGLSERECIGGAVLVAGFSETLGFVEHESFFREALRYDEVRRSAGGVVAIHSDDDPYVPARQGELLRDELGAELIIMPAAGHFSAGSGCTELPVVLEQLIGMMNTGGSTS